MPETREYYLRSFQDIAVLMRDLVNPEPGNSYDILGRLTILGTQMGTPAPQHDELCWCDVGKDMVPLFNSRGRMHLRFNNFSDGWNSYMLLPQQGLDGFQLPFRASEDRQWWMGYHPGDPMMKEGPFLQIQTEGFMGGSDYNFMRLRTLEIGSSRPAPDSYVLDRAGQLAPKGQ